MPALGTVSSGSAPEPIWLLHATTSTLNDGPTALATSRRDALRQRRDLRLRPRQGTQCRHSLRQPVGIAIELEGGFERGQPHLVDPQRPFHRIAIDLRDQFPAADDEAGLRAAEQLVARESNEIGAVGDSFRDRRLMRETEARQIDQRAGAEIVHERECRVLAPAWQVRARTPPW